MNKIIMTRGLIASGKSTWAKAYLKDHPNTKRVNRDELRAMVDNSKWSSENEKFILHLRDVIICETLSNGNSIIVDDTNFYKNHEYNLRQLAKQFGAEFEIREFDVPLEECIRRDNERIKPIGKYAIIKMYNQYVAKDEMKIKSVVTEKVNKDYPIPDYNNSNKSKAIICDLDGTLALLNGRNPFDAKTVYNDKPNYVVRNIIASYISRPKYKVIFMSGRKTEAREQTLRWLVEKCCFPTDVFDLHMRNYGDNRSDEIVKKELYEKYVKNTYDVVAVFDDRPKICRMWRYECGLMVFQLNDKEF